MFRGREGNHPLPIGASTRGQVALAVGGGWRGGGCGGVGGTAGAIDGPVGNQARAGIPTDGFVNGGGIGKVSIRLSAETNRGVIFPRFETAGVHSLPWALEMCQRMANWSKARESSRLSFSLM